MRVYYLLYNSGVLDDSVDLLESRNGDKSSVAAQSQRGDELHDGSDQLPQHN